MRETCFHCGLPLPAAGSRSAVLGGESRELCCAGCEAAARLIYASGLASYYEYREKSRTLPLLSPAPVESGAGPDYTHYDDSGVHTAFITEVDERHSEAGLIISGIRCAACVWLLESYLGEQEGVAEVVVNLANQRAFVKFDRARLTPSRIFSLIHALGYEAHPYRPGQAELLYEEERSRRIKELGLAAIVLMQVMMFSIALYAAGSDGMVAEYRSLFQWASLVLVVPLLLYSGASFFRSAWRDLRGGRAGMDLPVSLALAGAFVLSGWHTVERSGETYYDSIAMFTFFLLLGRFLEFQARYHSSRSSNELLSVFPPNATRWLESGGRETVALDQLMPGDRVVVEEGAVIPADGALCDEAAMIDRSALSGESVAVTAHAGDALFAGSINLEGEITVEVSRRVEQSLVSTVIRLSQRAAADKPEVATLADRVAARFVLVVLLVATGAALWWGTYRPDAAFSVVLSVLVVSCPCALSLAIPTALTVATYRLSEIGFLITRGHVLERLAAVRQVVFDKTGTLTLGTSALTEVRPLGEMSETECLEIAAALEQGIAHPVARALGGASRWRVDSRQHFIGQGVEGEIAGRRFRLGNPRFAGPQFTIETPDGNGRWLLLADATMPLAWLQLTDQLRADSARGISHLQGLGVAVAMITGDHPIAAAEIARQLDIVEAQSELSPEQKMQYISERLRSEQELVMVGDGVNDIAALNLATTSIVVKDASDFVQASSDAIILSNRIDDLPRAVQMARSTRKIIIQNLGWAVAYNLVALPLAVGGWVEPWLAALGMSASSLVVVGNSLRLNRVVL